MSTVVPDGVHSISSQSLTARISSNPRPRHARVGRRRLPRAAVDDPEMHSRAVVFAFDPNFARFALPVAVLDAVGAGFVDRQHDVGDSDSSGIGGGPHPRSELMPDIAQMICW